MIAEYKGKTYECSFYKGKIILISENCEDGFSEDFDGGYIKTVDRHECDRVYNSTPMVRYEGKAYLYYEETEDEIQLFVGDSDLSLLRPTDCFYQDIQGQAQRSLCRCFQKFLLLHSLCNLPQVF